ncbi:MAG: hypothetical protein LBF54_01005 [Holosporaceae bacterium]|jgi:hypothetical protein|nr:hypothetical protein [Holosporaceae bacterium]
MKKEVLCVCFFASLGVDGMNRFRTEIGEGSHTPLARTASGVRDDTGRPASCYVPGEERSATGLKSPKRKPAGYPSVKPDPDACPSPLEFTVSGLNYDTGSERLTVALMNLCKDLTGNEPSWLQVDIARNARGQSRGTAVARFRDPQGILSAGLHNRIVQLDGHEVRLELKKNKAGKAPVDRRPAPAMTEGRARCMRPGRRASSPPSGDDKDSPYVPSYSSHDDSYDSYGSSD